MGLIVSDKGGKTFEPVSAGVHLAVCYSLIDLGSTWSERYQKWQRQLLVTWEIPDERIGFTNETGQIEDKPRVISKTYTPSLNEKSHLRADLTSWRGRDFTPEELAGFELVKILGAPAQLNVIHVAKDGKTYANVKAVIPAPKGTRVTPENPLVAYDIEAQGVNIPNSVPDWVVEKIKASQEYQAMLGNDKTGATVAEDPVDTDEIPF